MSFLSRGYCPHLKALLHAYRPSIPRCFAKWYSNQPICDADYPNDTWENEIRIAPGQDATRLLSKLKPLLLGHAGPQPHRWHLCLEGQGIRRSFHFKTFNKTWAFMQAVSDRCKLERHHPEWWNSYNHTIIQWTTHKPRGLTIKDVDMAAWCDEQACVHAELQESEPTPMKLFDSVEAKV